MAEGGCLCGAVRYRLAAVRDAGLCHCARCRRGSGSAFATWAEGELQLQRGAVRSYQTRAFCEQCGTPLWDDAGGVRRVHAGTLDDPGALRPRVHCAAPEQLPWLRLADRWQWTAGAHTDSPPPPRPGSADPEPTRDSPVSLRQIAPETLGALLRLDVAGHQRRMVASNAVSLAQLPYAAQAWARGIHASERAVGFVQVEILGEDLGELPTRGEPFIWRFMIDAHYQKLGFGRRAIELVAEQARGSGAPRALWLSCEPPGPGSPHAFYRRLGFEDTGVRMEDEHILKRAYPAGRSPADRAPAPS